jgi:hypothetical protein
MMMMRRFLISKQHRSFGSNAIQDTVHRWLSSNVPPQRIERPHIRPKASNNITFRTRLPGFANDVVSNVIDQESTIPSDPTRPRASNPERYQFKQKKYKKWSKNRSSKPAKQTKAAQQAQMQTTSNDSTEQPKRSRPPTLPNKKAKQPSKENIEAKKRLQQKELAKLAARRFAERNLPTSEWVRITGIPPMSTLDDMLMSLQTVLDNEYDRGIVDLDADRSSSRDDEEGSLIKLDPSASWVKSARLILSNRYRPRGWRLQLSNRSVVHSLLQYHKEHGLKCAWKPVNVKEWREEDDPHYRKKNPQLQVSDSMIRVENCNEGMTVDHVRHLFRRFDLVQRGASVTELQQQEGQKDKVFLVHFADPSWARAAIREMQGVKPRESQLLLAQYPRQIL